MLREAAKKVMWPLEKNVIRRRMRNHTWGQVRDGGTDIHQGWDLEALVGTFCYSVCKGTVTDVNSIDQWPVGKNKKPQYGHYGLTVCISFEATVNNVPKKYTAFYAHLMEIFVKNGDTVSSDTIIGRTGVSGNAAPFWDDLLDQHLHFEIRNGDALDGLGGREDPAVIYGMTPLGCPISRNGKQECKALWPTGTHLH